MSRWCPVLNILLKIVAMSVDKCLHPYKLYLSNSFIKGLFRSLFVIQFSREIPTPSATSFQWLKFPGVLVFASSLKYFCHCSGDILSVFCGLSRPISTNLPHSKMLLYVFIALCIFYMLNYLPFNLSLVASVMSRTVERHLTYLS